MRIAQSSHFLMPLMVVSVGVMLLMSHLDMVAPNQWMNLWPLVLIAAGVEELYQWSQRGARR